FVAFGREVAKSGKPVTMTVRQLLRHFGQERRGSEVIRFINYKLRYLGLETSPRFDEVHIDGSVSIIPRPKRPPGRPARSTDRKQPSALVVEAALKQEPSELLTTSTKQ